MQRGKIYMNSDLQKLDELLRSKIDLLPENALADYLSAVLSGLERAKSGSPHARSGIFWALTRVFGCYDRLVAACEEYTTSHRDTVARLALV
jgi:hypothetical protein